MPVLHVRKAAFGCALEYSSNRRLASKCVIIRRLSGNQGEKGSVASKVLLYLSKRLTSTGLMLPQDLRRVSVAKPLRVRDPLDDYAAYG